MTARDEQRGNEALRKVQRQSVQQRPHQAHISPVVATPVLGMPRTMMRAPDILALHQTMGNRAVSRMLASPATGRDGGATRPSGDQPRRQVQMIARTPGGTPTVIQRAIGFEFETSYKIEKKDKTKESGYRPLQKMEKIDKYGPYLSMEADENTALGSTIEFVVDPPIQEDNAKGLQNMLGQFKKVGDALNGVRRSKDPIPLSRATGRSAHSPFLLTPTLSGLEGNPQITSGIAFDKIFALMKEANKPVEGKDKKAQIDITATIGGGAETQSLARIENLPGFDTMSEQLKGLIALLARYISFGRAGGGKDMLNYTKLIANSFMLRTDFGTMFNKLPPDDKIRFIGDRQAFIDLVLSAADVAGAGGTALLERGVRKNNVPTSNDYRTPLVNDATQLTRDKWLRNITMGQDLMSSSFMPHLKGELEGLGALGSRTDRVGDDPKVKDKKAKDKGEGIIMEFRNMKRNVFYTDFIAMADRVFNYIVGLNAR